MIGSIPSFNNQTQSLSDSHLYPQQITPMYASNGYDGSNPGSTYLTGDHSQYEYPNTDPNLFAQSPPDFRQGSFADVGAAFGFHPDIPIQISSHNLPQSPSSHFDVYPTAPYQNAQMFQSLPLTNIRQSDPGGFPAWNAGRLNSDSRHTKRQRQSQFDSEEDEPNEPVENMEHTGRPTRLCVCHRRGR